MPSRISARLGARLPPGALGGGLRDSLTRMQHSGRCVADRGWAPCQLLKLTPSVAPGVSLRLWVIPMRKRDPTIVLSGVPGELDLTVSARPVASRRQLTWSGTTMPGLRRRGSTAGAALCQTLRSRSRQA
jgi:hypothetical protein